MRQDFLEGQLRLLNYAINKSYTYEQWQQVANFMIQKEAGNNKIHRLRMIHLYEAD